MRRTWDALLTLLLLLSSAGFAQESARTDPVSQSALMESANSLNQILEASKDRGQLEMAGSAPFHLMASYEQFDALGNSISRGTVDALWESPHRYRLTLNLPPLQSAGSNKSPGPHSANLPAQSLIEVDNGTLSWRTGRWVIPGEIGQEPVLSPFYLRTNSDDELSLESAPKSNPDLDCIGSQPKIPGIADGTKLALTTYCMQKGNHLLRLMLLPNFKEIAFDDLQPFGAKFVPRTIRIAVHGKIRLKLHVDLLEAVTDFTSLDAAPPDSAQIFHFHRADQPFRSGELMEGQFLAGPSPMYPHAGLEGTISIKLHVGTAGDVESASILESQNQALKAPVLAAVKSWRFRVSYQYTKVVPVDHIYVFRFDGFQQMN